MENAGASAPGSTATAITSELVDLVPELICRFGVDGVLTYANRACSRFHGASVDALVNRPIADFLAGGRSDSDALLQLIDGLRPEAPTTLRHVLALDHSGAQHWQEWSMTGVFIGDDLVEIIGVGREATDRVIAEKRSRFHADHDDLTGLLNRRKVMDALTRLSERARYSGQPIGVVFVDIDDFKQVNDTFGHHAGDDVLVAVAKALQRILRVDDLVGRIGGDEFVAIINPATPEILDSVGQRLAEQLTRLPMSVSVSVGTALSDENSQPNDLLRLADGKMYSNKARRTAAAADDAVRAEYA